MDSARRLSELLRTLYAAVRDAELWAQFLEGVSSEAGATTAMIIAADERGTPVFCNQVGIEHAAQKTYEEHFFDRDIIRAGIEAADKNHGGWIGMRQELISDRELEASEYYNDFMRPLDHYHQVGGTFGSIPGYSIAGITLLRSQKDRMFEPEVASLLQLLTPHLKHALLLHQYLNHLDVKSQMLDRAACKTDLTFVAVNSKGAIQAMSITAESILVRADGLLYVGRQLRAEMPQEDEVLQRLISDAVGIASQSIHLRRTSALGVSMLLSRRIGRSLRLTVSPLMEDSGSGCAPLAIVFICDPEAQLASRATALRELFRLHPSEARFADAFLLEMDMKRAAERMRLTENSARFLLKSVFRKTGVKSQGALIRLMLTIPGVHNAISHEGGGNSKQ